METRTPPRRALLQLWSLCFVGLLLISVVLGVLALAGRVDRNLHGMVAFVTAAAGIASHMRRGSGWDFLAALAFVVTVGLGLAAQGEGGAAHVHLAVAVLTVVLSGGLHLAGWRGESRGVSGYRIRDHGLRVRPRGNGANYLKNVFEEDTGERFRVHRGT